MKIGYAKLGRSHPVRYFKMSMVGGDQEVIRLFENLTVDHEVHLIGRNQAHSDKTVYGYEPANTVNHWEPGQAFGDVPMVDQFSRDPDSAVYRKFIRELDRGVERLPKLDAVIVWLGQNSAVSSFLPRMSGVGHTTPLMSQINYVYPILHYLNKRRIKPIWILPDARNLLRCRDLTTGEQRQVIAQYDRDHEIQYQTPEGIKRHTVRYRYSGNEFLILDPGLVDEQSFKLHALAPPELLFGLLQNEGRSDWVGWAALADKFLNDNPYGTDVTEDYLDYWFRTWAPDHMKFERDDPRWRLAFTTCLRCLRITASGEYRAHMPYRLVEAGKGAYEVHEVKPGDQLEYNATVDRYMIIQRWLQELNRLEGFELVGKWSVDAQWLMRRKITPVPITEIRPTMRRWRSTMTMPPTADSHSNAFVTGKHWEAFAVGTVCFRPRGLVDVQNHAFGSAMPAWLEDFLTVGSATELHHKVMRLQDDEFWRSVVNLQFKYIQERMATFDQGFKPIKSALDVVASEGPK